MPIRSSSISGLKRIYYLRFSYKLKAKIFGGGYQKHVMIVVELARCSLQVLQDQSLCQFTQISFHFPNRVFNIMVTHTHSREKVNNLLKNSSSYKENTHHNNKLS